MVVVRVAYILGGSVSVNNLDLNPTAYIDGNAIVNADGSVGVIADSNLNLDLITGGVGIATSGLAVGVGTSVLTVDNTVSAYIKGTNTQINAKGNGAGIEVFNGTKDNRDKRLTETVNGVAIIATAADDLQAIAAAGGISGGADRSIYRTKR